MHSILSCTQSVMHSILLYTQAVMLSRLSCTWDCHSLNTVMHLRLSCTWDCHALKTVMHSILSCTQDCHALKTVMLSRLSCTQNFHALKTVMHSHDCHALLRLSCTQDCPKGKCFNLHSNSRMVKLCLATVLLSLSVPKRKHFNFHSNRAFGTSRTASHRSSFIGWSPWKILWRKWMHLICRTQRLW